MFTRRLGRSGIEVGALGLGCWAIGGPMTREGRPIGWGAVDDAESIRAVRRALDLGVTLFDTADVYGCGHSERVLGEALRGRRTEAIIATKFGAVFDEETRQMSGFNTDPPYIRRACEASLRRLGTDRIDVYQFHLGEVRDESGGIRDTLESLVKDGKIRWYGRSSSFLEDVRGFSEGGHCVSAQSGLNLIENWDRAGEIDVYASACEELDLAWLTNSPLAKGILTGKFSPDSRLPDDDVRRRWDFRDGPQAAQLRALDRVRGALTADGRSLAHGAIGWIWARSGRTIPIPGFKTVAQVEELAGAARFGPLPHEQMLDVARAQQS